MKLYFFTVKTWFQAEQGYCVRAASPREAWHSVLTAHDPASLTSVALFDIRHSE